MGGQARCGQREACLSSGAYDPRLDGRAVYAWSERAVKCDSTEERSMLGARGLSSVILVLARRHASHRDTRRHRRCRWWWPASAVIDSCFSQTAESRQFPQPAPCFHDDWVVLVPGGSKGHEDGGPVRRPGSTFCNGAGISGGGNMTGGKPNRVPVSAGQCPPLPALC